MDFAGHGIYANRCHPLYMISGRRPVISNPFVLGKHEGVDLMYDRLPTDPPYEAGDPRGTRDFYVPKGALAAACADGRVRYSRDHPNGWRIEFQAFDRPSLFMYLHLVRGSERFRDGDKVVLGEVLAEVGGDPSPDDEHHTIHIHFGTRSPTSGFYDPALFIGRWPVLPLPGAARVG